MEEYQKRLVHAIARARSRSPVPVPGPGPRSPPLPQMYTFAWRTWPGVEPGEKPVLLAMLRYCVGVSQDGGAFKHSSLFTPKTVQPLSH